jgi:hypothetical protein
MTTHEKYWRRAPLVVWLGLRILTVPVAILALVYERGGLVGTSLREILAEPWHRYDTFYYVRIVTVGYQSGDITSGFHPLFPWLSTLAAAIVHSSLGGLMLVSSLAGIGLTILIYRLARFDIDHDKAWTLLAGNARDIRTVHGSSLPVSLHQLFCRFAHAPVRTRRIDGRARCFNASTRYPFGPTAAMGIVGSFGSELAATHH